MSTGAQVALLPPSSRHASPPRLGTEVAVEQPLLRLAAFAALGLYGVLRWSTLLSPAPDGRLIGLLGLAVAVVAVRTLTRTRLLVPIAAVIAALAAFAVAGVPLSWVVHLRIAVTSRAIGDGLSALPRALVPYGGLNEWVRLVIVLGAAVLLLDAALLLAFAPRALGDLRRAGAALPMVALATVPATLVHPKFPYLDGLVLFVLLAAFMWGEHVRRDQLGGALGLGVAVAAVAMVVAPVVDPGKPWVNPRGLAGGLAPAHVETFDWSQTYGPIHWPRKGRAVFSVQASEPAYWKAEDLDVFDQGGWGSGSVIEGGDPMATVSRAALARWTQTLHVTVSDMSTNEVIAAGDATGKPQGLPESLFAGASAGTWTTASQVQPGDSYSIAVYAPAPSPSQLATAGARYPQSLLPGYLTITVPGSGTGQGVEFPAFHSTLSAAYGPAAFDPASVMLHSPYARAYRLARRLARRSRTPYAFVTGVEGYLAHGYTYNEAPPPSAYPLESFLFRSKEGYCQQFAGAMALLLRMGGVPARVSVGFTTGKYDSATRSWIVDDLGAHAWVEAWFPGYGWVQFDPTPPADPALGGQLPNVGGAGGLGGPATKTGHGTRAGVGALGAAAGRRAHSKAGGISAAPLAGIAAALAVVVILALLTRSLPGGAARIAELERALARTGRPVSDGTTLAVIERRLGAETDAGAYVKSLRLGRFAGSGDEPTPAQRRALRVALGAGLGPLGRLRALWALPPRRGPRRRSASHPWRAYTGS